MRTDIIFCLNPSGFHKMSFTVWGEEHATMPPVFCVHGLMNNGRIFDPLAKVLSRTRTVYCPDIVGRGLSDRLSEPSHYEQRQYVSDLTALIAYSGAKQVDWIGTSMGGITGMLMAAQPNTPLRRLVLNDVGPIVSKESVERIKNTFSEEKTFASVQEAEQTLRQMYKGFGPLSPEAWAHITKHETRRNHAGLIEFNYDRGILEPIQALKEDVDLWPVYDAISCPTLVLRGGESKLLTEATTEAMAKRGPRAEARVFPGIGHAPSLMTEDQIESVLMFLNHRQDKVTPAPASARSPN